MRGKAAELTASFSYDMHPCGPKIHRKGPKGEKLLMCTDVPHSSENGPTLKTIVGPWVKSYCRV